MGYGTAEIAAALGIDQRSARRRAAGEAWPCARRQGRGGGREYQPVSLPQDVRDAILAWELKKASQAGASSVPAATAPVSTGAVPAVPASAGLPVTPAGPTSALTHAQRKVMVARLGFIREIERRVDGGMGKGEALNSLVAQSKDGTLPAHLARLVEVANDRGGAERGLSRRTLQRWQSLFALAGERALAPARVEKDLTIPPWAEAFLACWRDPQKPSVVDAYTNAFGPPHAPHAGAPSIHAVRRFLDKLTVLAREEGRRTGNAWLSLMPYVRRDTSDLTPTEIYTMDGTTMDVEVLHPDTGRPFKPEVTFVIDVATRECVGLSIALAESAAATLDALRMACLYLGIPAIVYADNGPGYQNALWTAEGLGMMDRLGSTLTHSIRCRPQGKGLMERAVKTACNVVKQFITCTHADMDRDAAKKVYKLSRKGLKNGQNILPTLREFAGQLLARIELYNATPHRALPKITDETTGKRRRLSPREYRRTFVDQGWQPCTVDASLREELFMPSETRKVSRGWIAFHDGKYFSKSLEELHGEAVEVRYDVFDASRVYVWSLDGVKICEAELDGNTTPYLPRPMREAAAEKRRKGQLKRLEAKANAIEPGAVILRPESDAPEMLSDVLVAGRDAREVRDVAAIDVTPLPATTTPADDAKRPLFMSSIHHFRWLMEHRDQCTEADEAWLARYATTPEYADLADRYAFEGIAYAPQEAAQRKAG
ncbi:Mu transposase C-terminal domain-containing protein [Megalodesulfovibrio gigas]|uniref:Putative Transposase-like Mu n=1 Tax=Megalodesulfovibrio gigas (strain ATCC 19364 / DSM 1382 / NCIMB 9332 / VKM B-1759) TaxID=1121448 RepID=T2G9K2_MEGG1|nr:Mu transposase C-terminal domain-containing protein [Megalodesulfovibrio gigas]AGW12806.1 putative Transposase-like Mu [Megalodesulfovibrio gigas DSM 1382 = ATCC 19364]